MGAVTRSIDSTLPAPSLAAKCASMSDDSLLFAVRVLAKRNDPASLVALAAARAEIAKRPGLREVP